MQNSHILRGIRLVNRASTRLPRLCMAAAVVASAGSCLASDEMMVSWQGRTMGSPYTVKVVGAVLASNQLQVLQAEIEGRLKEINRQMSHYQSDSELSRFNQSPAGVPFKVSPEFAEVVRMSLALWHRSGGAFDPTLAPVVNLWGFGEKTEEKSIPSAAQLQAALKKTGAQHLSVTDRGELLKDIPDLNLNLSAIAKGFAVDEMARVLQRHGLTNIYASIAGEVLALGHNPRGAPWQVGIAAPVSHWNESDPMAGAVSLSNQALSTSGDYQKFFLDEQGRRFCHIFDPKNGWPVQHNLAGVSVVAANSMTADALATTLFVLGPERGIEFIEGWTNAAALFIVRDSQGSFRTIPSARFKQLMKQ